jgi:hybrid cluster-associated redox disulfide protein
MEKVTADSPIILTVQQHPEILEIFMQYGLGCVGCMAANFETIGQGAAAHGLDIDALLADINDCIETVEGKQEENQEEVKEEAK